MPRDAKVTQIGLDCHRNFSNATARDGKGKVVWRQRLEHRDRKTLRGALGEWPGGMPVILEGTFGWGWLSDELSAAGLEPHLASSKKVAAWRDARGLSKSNRVDADLLSELWNQQPRWWEVWLAPPEVRDQRERLRYRMTLVRIQTGLKNRVHAILHRHGIAHDFHDLFGAAGRRFLQGLMTPESTLGDAGRETMKGYWQLLDQVRRQIAAATQTIRQFVHRTPPAERLRTLPGVNYILAYTILAEIGRIERFRGARQLASYSLLAPLADDSGEDDGGSPQGRHVGHCGRRTLKWAFIEASHSAIRGDARMRAIFDQRTNGGKRDRNRGHIAVAHELCRVTYVVLRKEVEYTLAPPVRPGTRRRRRTSRPGTGQPDVAMVAASMNSRLQTSL